MEETQRILGNIVYNNTVTRAEPENVIAASSRISMPWGRSAGSIFVYCWQMMGYSKSKSQEKVCHTG